MTRTYLLAVRAACVVCVVAGAAAVPLAVQRGHQIDGPDPSPRVVDRHGNGWVLGGWTHAEWAGDQVGEAVAEAVLSDAPMRGLGFERCASWVSPLVPESERGPVWCWPTHGDNQRDER